jgi:hypothetical protein
MRLKRGWSKELGGYAYRGRNYLTKCQCNTSVGGCTCGKYQEDVEKELQERAKEVQARRA